jgi:poly-gamma-glutamate synthesis protein (capsule biosynthesis protein)
MRTISHRRHHDDLAALDDAGLGHAGTARSVEEAVVRVFDVSGVAVAHLSYTTFANSPPPARPWMNVAGSAREVIEAVRAVRGAGAEIVILSLHIAKEMLSYPTTYDRAFVADVTADEVTPPPLRRELAPCVERSIRGVPDAH